MQAVGAVQLGVETVQRTQVSQQVNDHTHVQNEHTECVRIQFFFHINGYGHAAEEGTRPTNMSARDRATGTTENRNCSDSYWGGSSHDGAPEDEDCVGEYARARRRLDAFVLWVHDACEDAQGTRGEITGARSFIRKLDVHGIMGAQMRLHRQNKRSLEWMPALGAQHQ